jgi:hypothetical protein
VEVASVSQVWTGEHTAQEAVAYSLHLEVARLPEARKGFVLMP